MSFSATFSHIGTYSVSGEDHGEAGRRCALSHNPSGDQRTDLIRVAFAATMQVLIDERNQTEKPAEDATPAEVVAYNDKMRLIATSLTDLEKTQMVSLRSLHVESNAGVGTEAGSAENAEDAEE